MYDCIKKEVKYGIRNYKFLLLIAVFIGYAIFTPIMTKYILPQVLETQFPNMPQEVVNQMINGTQIGVMQAYINDIMQIGLLALVFGLASCMASEIKGQTLVLPVVSGKKYSHIVLSKFIVFSLAIYLVTLVAFVINYLYAGMLFSFDLSIMSVIISGSYLALNLIFIFSLTLLIGTITKKMIVTGILATIIALVIAIIGSLLDITNYIPSGLQAESVLFNSSVNSVAFVNVISSLIITLGVVFLTILKFKNSAINERN